MKRILEEIIGQIIGLVTLISVLFLVYAINRSQAQVRPDSVEVDVMAQRLECKCTVTHLDGIAIYRDVDTNEVIGTWKED